MENLVDINNMNDVNQTINQKKNIKNSTKEEETEEVMDNNSVLIDMTKINSEQLEKNLDKLLDKIISNIDINELFEDALIINEERNININNYSITNKKKKETTIYNCKYCNKEFRRPKCLEKHENKCKKIK